MADPAFVTMWTSTVAQDIYLIVRGKIQSQTAIKGVLSCSRMDTTTYDGTTYRNELSAAYIGRPWANFAQNLAPVPPAFTYGTSIPAQDGVVGASAGLVQTQDSITAKDDQYNATPPFPTAKMESFFVFWSGAPAASNVLAMCRVDEFTEYSIVPSQTIF